MIDEIFRRTYKSPQETLGINDYENPELPTPTSCQASDQFVWKAARASGAAPSFFRPEGNFVDGGIISNNPSLDLLTEIAEYNVAQRAIGHEEEVVKPTILVSLGTGVIPLKKVNWLLHYRFFMNDARTLEGGGQGFFTVVYVQASSLKSNESWGVCI